MSQDERTGRMFYSVMGLFLVGVMLGFFILIAYPMMRDAGRKPLSPNEALPSGAALITSNSDGTERVILLDGCYVTQKMSNIPGWPESWRNITSGNPYQCLPGTSPAPLK